ncbi:CapA family protein [Mesorhizobium sp. ORS 3428]|uniref:CapA family protein n=1 Tax=Mesorhizobium sp. ORS 3428 TaxID=540997 RepID=UPI000ADE9D63|nr:CapA family protein [Mesorhizobium sp. ORS 3428]
MNVLASLDENALAAVIHTIDRWRRPGDVVLVSVHWGPNWGYEVPVAHTRFAHGLIDSARVDVVHAHSSHHPLAIEVRSGKPILYGCGDFINDYEGIGGHEAFRPDLSLAYFVDLDDMSHHLLSFEMVPFRMQKFRLARASDEEAAWLGQTLDRECRRFGGHVRLSESEHNTLVLPT